MSDHLIAFFFYLEPHNSGRADTTKVKVCTHLLYLKPIEVRLLCFLQQPAPLKRTSAADIIGRRSQPTYSPPTLSVAPPTKPPAPPAADLKKSPGQSPPLEISSPLGHLKPAQPSTASNSVFEQFKKQALENKERVSSCCIDYLCQCLKVCLCPLRTD